MNDKRELNIYWMIEKTTEWTELDTSNGKMISTEEKVEKRMENFVMKGIIHLLLGDERNLDGAQRD